MPSKIKYTLPKPIYFSLSHYFELCETDYLKSPGPSIYLFIFERELHLNEYLPLLSKQMHQPSTLVFQLKFIFFFIM